MINMLVAVDICTEDYAPVWNIVGLVVNIIKIGIPIVLILFGMIDLSKAVIANKEDEVKKATKLLGKRFLYAVGVFASVWIVTLVLDIAAGTIGKNNENYDYSEASWKKCWALVNGETADKKCYYNAKTGETVWTRTIMDEDSWERIDKITSGEECIEGIAKGYSKNRTDSSNSGNTGNNPTPVKPGDRVQTTQ